MTYGCMQFLCPLGSLDEANAAARADYVRVRPVGMPIKRSGDIEVQRSKRIS